MKASSLIILFYIFNSQAAVYNDDDRELIYRSSNNFIQKSSLSIAAKLRNKPDHIISDLYQIESKPLKEHIKNLCTDEKFADVQTYSNCTGFLVGDDLMVTAGHCINTQKECDESSWVFTSEIAPYDKNPLILKEEIYQCENIVSRIKNSISRNDYTLFKLRRKTNRPVLPFRKQGRIKSDEQFMVIGHPTGLPLVATTSTKVIDNSSEFLFKINSDTFGGNSGSPVFNRETHLVEGILTDGDTDYRLNKDKGCVETYHCPKSECKGENVVRITNIPELVPDMTPKEPIVDFNNLRL